MSSTKGPAAESSGGPAKGLAAHGATATSGSGDIKRSLELLWGTGERPTRGPKPGLTLDRIVTAAIGIADAEGLAAVSMRRLATDLGTGTMSLYRYVPGKAELLDLMLDRVYGEDATETADDLDWRAAVEAMAHAHRELYRRHPWLLRVNQARSVLGPGSLRSLEVCLGPLRTMGFTDPEMLSVILAVQSFASGMARMEIDAVEAARDTGLSDEEFWGGQTPFLEKAMETGEFPLLAQLSEETFGSEFDHFAFGLQRLLDGLGRLVEGRTSS
ncbi:TetR/AcrR family transcriptional regulator [Streptomyces sp. NPDC002851]